MNRKAVILGVVMSLMISTCAFALSDHSSHEQKSSVMGQEQKGSMMEHMKEKAPAVVEAGNKICPVTGEKVGEMGPAVRYEYQGRIYNLCCAGCVKTFKNDPEKYVKIVEEQMGQHKEIGSEHGHESHHHEMGQADKHMMMESADEKLTRAKEKVAPGVQVEEFDLQVYQYGYSPERIVVKKGNIVKLHATSRDVPHGIFIKEYGINITVKKGVVEEIEFVADKAGEFDILCSVYCGRGHHSMKAKLIVEE